MARSGLRFLEGQAYLWGVQVRFGKTGGYLLRVGGLLSFRLVRLYVGCTCSFW